MNKKSWGRLVHMQWTIYQRPHGTLITQKPVSVSGHTVTECWKVSAENEYQNGCQGAPAAMENITWSAPSYSLYSQDVHSCCCSSSHKEKLPRCTRHLACCGRAGSTSCSPRQAHNVPTVVLYSFVLLIFSWAVKVFLSWYRKMRKIHVSHIIDVLHLRLLKWCFIPTIPFSIFPHIPRLLGVHVDVCIHEQSLHLHQWN